MKKLLTLATLSLITLSAPAFPSDQKLLEELEALKQRVELLERKLREKSESEKEIAEEVKELKEKLGSLEIHGGAVVYYQGANADKVDGEELSNPSGTGYVADLELSFKPHEDGEFYMRLHAGEGTGADEKLGEMLFANLNTIADDNPEDNTFNLLEAYYTHELFNGKLSLTIGKTEPLAFVDDNEFANDEAAQFVGKPFVNNPIIDSEDEYAPIVALTFSPAENFEISALVQSNQSTTITWDGGEWVAKEKSVYDDVFDNPFYAVQLKYSAEFNGLPGNYRLYFWDDSADHIKIGQPTDNPTKKPSTDDGWGVGISIDQMVTENVGVFARASWANDDVYEIEQFYSAGISITGLFNSRPKDTLGFGVAAVVPNDKLENDDVEYHFEGYYRFQISENFAITPDFQFVANPHGDSDNDNVFAGMVRAEFSF